MTAKNTLTSYQEKRNFSHTPEPSNQGEHPSKQPIFVIQKHDARRLHYDFRLEVNGVLKSWAVPKGPSTDPREKRLAILVEDHPLAYADFEGVIPEGEYGAGTVLVWDTGPYRNLRAEKDKKPVSMEQAFAEGKIEVWLQGKKLQGGYTLIRTIRGKERWLLTKMDDEKADARRNPISTEPLSVLSGRSLEDITDQETPQQ